MSSAYLLLAIGMILGYAYFFYRGHQVQKGGGFQAYARAHLNQRFGLSGDEQVSAAWSAVTVPKLNAGEKAAEIVGAAAAVVVGVGVQVVGRPLGVACTTRNRVLVLDTKDDVLRAFGPEGRPRFVQTGKKGTKRPSQTRMGWDDGAIVRLEVPGEEPVEIDVATAAVELLAAWSHGGDVAQLSGPFPAKGAI